MKRLLVFFLLALICVSPAFAETHVVKRVLEGDLLELSNGQKVRLIGIDVPDSQPSARAKMFAERSGKKLNEILSVGKKAKKFVQALVEGKEVRVEHDIIERDEEGTMWGYVYSVAPHTGDENQGAVYYKRGKDVFINATIVRSGYASPLIVPPNIAHTQTFKQMFLEAKKNKRGLWNR